MRPRTDHGGPRRVSAAHLGSYLGWEVTFFRISPSMAPEEKPF